MRNLGCNKALNIGNNDTHIYLNSWLVLIVVIIALFIDRYLCLYRVFISFVLWKLSKVVSCETNPLLILLRNTPQPRRQIADRAWRCYPLLNSDKGSNFAAIRKRNFYADVAALDKMLSTYPSRKRAFRAGLFASGRKDLLKMLEICRGRVNFNGPA